MKRFFGFLLFIAISCGALAQTAQQRFSPQQMQVDMHYLKEQILTVHAYPYSELSKTQYENLFKAIEPKLKDSLTIIEFYRLIKPMLSYLSDEHARMGLSDKMIPDVYKTDAVFLPLSLSKSGKFYMVNAVLSDSKELKAGDRVTHIDNVPVEIAVNRCASFNTGFPNQRLEKALQQFGDIYTLANPAIQHVYIVKTAMGKTVKLQGVTISIWQNYISQQSGSASKCEQLISYQKIGDSGYITSCSFGVNDKDMGQMEDKVRSIFEQIQKDNVKYLFIDVSDNSGGNSAVGTLLINYFYDKPFRTYQCNFRKSQSYVQLLKKWGMQASDKYLDTPDGQILHYDSDTTHPGDNPLRFKGKVFVVVGKKTFSSAMMFATEVKDNHMAELVGELSQDGHPNHFGELYMSTLPNTKLDFQFGVKEWIRPNGKAGENLLRPDIIINLTGDKQQLVNNIESKVK